MVLRREDPFHDQQFIGLMKELNDISSDMERYVAFLTQRDGIMQHFQLHSHGSNN